MVVAIVISSIMAIGIVDFIGRSVEGISSSANRNQLASAGRMALARLGMELHNSLPNSIRETTATAGVNTITNVTPMTVAFGALGDLGISGVTGSTGAVTSALRICINDVAVNSICFAPSGFAYAGVCDV